MVPEDRPVFLISFHNYPLLHNVLDVTVTIEEDYHNDEEED